MIKDDRGNTFPVLNVQNLENYIMELEQDIWIGNSMILNGLGLIDEWTMIFIVSEVNIKSKIRKRLEFIMECEHEQGTKTSCLS